MFDAEPIDPKVATALEKFIADWPEPITGPEAIWVIVKLYLRQNGYMDGGAAKTH